MIAVRSIIFAEARGVARKWSVIVVKSLNVSLMVGTADCVVGLRTKSAIVTGGGVLIEVNPIIFNVYFPLLLESNSCCKQKALN